MLGIYINPPETGFYYVSSRYYNPGIGRFISADTTDILGVSGDLYDKNLYAYCDNNPVVRADSNGTLWYMLIGATLGGVISGGLEFISQARAGGSYDISKILIATASGAHGGLFAATSLTIGAQIAINAGIGVGSYIADSVAHNEAITLGGVILNGAAGAASGAIGVATVKFTGGALVSRTISNIGKSISTWWKNLWK